MRYGVTLSLLALVACGGTDSTNNNNNNSNIAQLKITSSGVSTLAGASAIISVPNQGVVTFTNNDTVAHSITSPTSGCSALNTGTLAAGVTSAQLVLSNNSSTGADLVCSFGDTVNTSAAFTGQVTVLTSSTGGSGY